MEGRVDEYRRGKYAVVPYRPQPSLPRALEEIDRTQVQASGYLLRDVVQPRPRQGRGGGTENSAEGGANTPVEDISMPLRMEEGDEVMETEEDRVRHQLALAISRDGYYDRLSYIICWSKEGETPTVCRGCLDSGAQLTIASAKQVKEAGFRIREHCAEVPRERTRDANGNYRFTCGWANVNLAVKHKEYPEIPITADHITVHVVDNDNWARLLVGSEVLQKLGLDPGDTLKRNIEELILQSVKDIGSLQLLEPPGEGSHSTSVDALAEEEGKATPEGENTRSAWVRMEALEELKEIERDNECFEIYKEVVIDLWRKRGRGKSPSQLMDKEGKIISISYLPGNEVKLSKIGSDSLKISIPPAGAVAIMRSPEEFVAKYEQKFDIVHMLGEDFITLDISRVQSKGLLAVWVEPEDLPRFFEKATEGGYRPMETVTWIKHRPDQPAVPKKREGRLLMRSSEVCFIMAKGVLQNGRVEKRSSTSIMAAEGSNRLKPKEIYEILEKLLPKANRLDLNGQKKGLRKGWVSVGTDMMTRFDRKEKRGKEVQRWKIDNEKVRKQLHTEYVGEAPEPERK